METNESHPNENREAIYSELTRARSQSPSQASGRHSKVGRGVQTLFRVRKE